MTAVLALGGCSRRWWGAWWRCSRGRPTPWEALSISGAGGQPARRWRRPARAPGGTRGRAATTPLGGGGVRARRCGPLASAPRARTRCGRWGWRWRRFALALLGSFRGIGAKRNRRRADTPGRACARPGSLTLSDGHSGEVLLALDAVEPGARRASLDEPATAGAPGRW